MPLNSQYLAAINNEAVEERDYIQNLQLQLGEVLEVIDIYDRAEPFLRHLRQMESSALELMVSGPPEDMATTRERVKVIRELLSAPASLERKRQELEQLLEVALTQE